MYVVNEMYANEMYANEMHANEMYATVFYHTQANKLSTYIFENPLLTLILSPVSLASPLCERGFCAPP